MSTSSNQLGRAKAKPLKAKEPEPVQEPVRVFREVLTDLTVRRETLDDIGGLVVTRWHPKDIHLYRGGRPVGERCQWKVENGTFTLVPKVEKK